MIINWSRISQFQECRRKAYNWDALRLSSWREADALLTGGGFHVGAAVLFATKDVQKAVAAAEKDMRDRYATQVILAEEKPIIEHGIEWTKRAVAKFAEHYEGQDVQVLWPEVAFCLPMPNSWHHCHFAHKLLYPPPAPPREEPPAITQIAKRPACESWKQCQTEQGLVLNHVSSMGVEHSDMYPSEGRCPTCSTPVPKCFMPHYFKGKTDAVVEWMTKVWLFEHKTNAQAPEIFYKRYLLDAQATGYMYGIWKTLGVKPEGFILNVIQKPYKNAKDQLAVGFGREPYFRSNEDLERFALELVEQANDYERAFAAADGGNIAAVYMNTKSCTNYNRQCYYMDYCQRMFVANEGEFHEREEDYVEAEYKKVLQLETA
jgi:hypothetical protein